MTRASVGCTGNPLFGFFRVLFKGGDLFLFITSAGAACSGVLEDKNKELSVVVGGVLLSIRGVFTSSFMVISETCWSTPRR